MKLEVEKNQVMKKCHYCEVSDYDGKCVLHRSKGRIKYCKVAVEKLVEAEKGGGSDV